MIRRAEGRGRVMSERNRIIPDEAEFHPAANLFPPTSEEEFAELVEDIDTNGVREPIWVDEDGLVLDGRHTGRPRRSLSGLRL